MKGETDMPSCVVFSERAFISLLVETQEKLTTETGGVFLGYRKEDIWYVIESIDPGPQSIFRATYFEYDQAYVNHLINKVSRLYKTQLDLIGLWHRHPGSFDRFSGTDDITNTSYAELNKEGAVSALVNIDPNFRITMYEVKLPLQYKKIPIAVGDTYIPKELLAMRNPVELQNQMESDCLSSRVKKFSLLKSKKTEEEQLDAEISRISISDSTMLLQLTHALLHVEVSNEIEKKSILPIDKSIEQILIELENDISFLDTLGIICEMEPESSHVVNCYISDREQKITVGLFACDNGSVMLRYDGRLYKYRQGMFFDMYKQILVEGGVQE